MKGFDLMNTVCYDKTFFKGGKFKSIERKFEFDYFHNRIYVTIYWFEGWCNMIYKEECERFNR
jgi:hypothetical protein